MAMTRIFRGGYGPFELSRRKRRGELRGYPPEGGALIVMKVPGPTFDRITVEPDKCGGKPCIRGMRITVRRVLEILATYPDRADIFREYPFLEEDDLRQSLRYAAASVDLESVDSGSQHGTPLLAADERR